MNFLDIIFILVLAYGLVRGLIKGLIMELTSFVGVILGMLGARFYSNTLGEYLTQWFDISLTYAKPIAYFIIFFIIVLTCVLLAKLITRLLKIAMLGWLNRFLGGLFGMGKWVLILSVLLNVTEVIDSKIHIIPAEKKETTILYYPLIKVVPQLIPFISEEIEIGSSKEDELTTSEVEK